MNLPKELTTVTTVSKSLAMFLFIAVPFVGFLLGLKYEQQFTQYIESRASVDQYLLKNQPAATQSASTASPAPNGDRADWKTYTNSDLSFQYPSSWMQSSIQLNGTGSTQSWINPEGVYTLTLTKRANYNNGTGQPFTTLDDYLKNTPGEKKKITLSNIEAIQILPKESGSGTADQKTESDVYFFSQDKKTLFVFSFESKTSDMARVRIGSDTFDQILSTFKFTNQ